MCLLLFSYKQTPGFTLVLAANRDEFTARPTAELNFWPDGTLLGGRDLQDGGTWLAVSRSGRFGALTNFRETGQPLAHPSSRGEIIVNYLLSGEDGYTHLSRLQGRGGYRGYNLLLGDINNLYYGSNRSENIHRLKPGMYGLSNHLLDTPWPKVKRGKERFQQALLSGNFDHERLFEVLADRVVPQDQDLPDTGVGLQWERMLSTIHIRTPQYGTRSSAILTISEKKEIVFHERTFSTDCKDLQTESEKCFTMQVS